jgi:hypothetical protein
VKGLSCETQLIEFVDDITRNIDAGKQTDCLIMDFSKAFDKVTHSLLQHKTLHFSGWNAVNHDVSHFSSLSRSDWSVLASWSDEIVKYAIVSSAKSLTFDVIPSKHRRR